MRAGRTAGLGAEARVTSRRQGQGAGARQELTASNRGHRVVLSSGIGGRHATRRASCSATGCRAGRRPGSGPRGGCHTGGRMPELVQWTATQMAAAVAAGRVSAADLVAAHLAGIAARRPRCSHAFVDVRAEAALAEAADRTRAPPQRQPRGPLGGVPVTVKSAIDVTGLRCETGSPSRRGVRAAGDAEVVRAAARRRRDRARHHQRGRDADGLRDGQSAAWAHQQPVGPRRARPAGRAAASRRPLPPAALPAASAATAAGRFACRRTSRASAG